MYEGGYAIAKLKVRVGKRFTLTIPKEVREKLGIREGDELELVLLENGILLRKPLSLVEFLDSIKPRGSVESFVREREEEVLLDDERNHEIVKQGSY